MPLHASLFPATDLWDVIDSGVLSQRGGLVPELAGALVVLHHQQRDGAWQGLGSEPLCSIEGVSKSARHNRPLHHATKAVRRIAHNVGRVGMGVLVPQGYPFVFQVLLHAPFTEVGSLLTQDIAAQRNVEHQEEGCACRAADGLQGGGGMGFNTCRLHSKSMLAG